MAKTVTFCRNNNKEHYIMCMTLESPNKNVRILGRLSIHSCKRPGICEYFYVLRTCLFSKCSSSAEIYSCFEHISRWENSWAILILVEYKLMARYINVSEMRKLCICMTLNLNAFRPDPIILMFLKMLLCLCPCYNIYHELLWIYSHAVIATCYFEGST